MSANPLLRGKKDVPKKASDVKLPQPTVVASTATKSFFDATIAKFPMLVFIIAIVIAGIVGIAYLMRYSTFGFLSIDWKTGAISRGIITPALQPLTQYSEYPIPATTSTTFPSVLQYGYTVGFDVNISNPTPINNMYRVLFYNGAQNADPTVPVGDPSQKNNVGGAISYVGGPDPTSLSSIQNALNSKFSNLCVYMAQDTNDLYITYYVGHMSKNDSGSSVESLDGWYVSKGSIQNVPINTPFRITLAVDGQFIETYLNGELVMVTKTSIPGNTSNLHAYNSSYNYNFYGPPDSMYLAGIRVANIKYWGSLLPSKSIRVFSTVPSSPTVFSS
jgi:hypothetical protein